MSIRHLNLAMNGLRLAIECTFEASRNDDSVDACDWLQKFAEDIVKWAGEFLLKLVVLLGFNLFWS
jgi:hypothetical protein